MTVFFVTLTVFILAMFAMAVGVLTGRTRIQGSCGGIGGRCEGDGGSSCDLCQSSHSAQQASGTP